jgi:putative transposase
MARPYSLDLRERVVSAVASGQTCRAVASNFDVAVSTVVKWVGRVRRTGSVAPGKMGGHRPYILEPERDWLLARLEEKPDLTLHALGQELTDRGVSVSCDTLWRFLKREGISFKKNAARRRTGSARRGKTAQTLAGVSGQT